MANTLHDQAVSYWSRSTEQLFTEFSSSASGLTSAEAESRLARYGLNRIREHHAASAIRMLAGQFTSPLILILVFAVVVSIAAGEWTDAAVVLVIVAGSGLLGFGHEYFAAAAVERLRARVAHKAMLVRDGILRDVDAQRIVPGDVLALSAGSLVAADAVIFEANDFFVNEAVLTGEPFPVEKRPEVATDDSTLAHRTNCVFMGTNVRSGAARAIVVRTGTDTEYGHIAGSLEQRPPKTDFENGLHQFGIMLTQAAIYLVLIVFAANILRAQPLADSLLFAIALAVGLAPELLPAIFTVTLSKGAQRMAANGVIVRRLSAIEDLGSMDILCTDKTGTLTEGVIHLDRACDTGGNPSEDVLLQAALTARFQSGLANPLDEALLRETAGKSFEAFSKVNQNTIHFILKRLSNVASAPGQPTRMVTKGAFEKLLAVCDTWQTVSGPVELDAVGCKVLRDRFDAWSNDGYRVLGVAAKAVPSQAHYSREAEVGLTFLGYLVFLDPPKPGASDAIAGLKSRGVELKIITGDARGVTAHVAGAVGLEPGAILTGADLREMGDDALGQAAVRTSLFVEMDPSQKERVIRSLRGCGHVVGYLGDGINDAPALHAASVGVSVDGAVDVAKEAACVVLLEHSLDVLSEGIDEGRRTFANTLKYIFTTTSANFGNMLSMAGASLFLPFLPLLAKQILLNNFLSDLPGMAIAADNVDRDWIDSPRRWDIRFLRRFMIVFGLVSAAFDLLTFLLLLLWFRATADVFRTAWLVESLLTELVIALVVRTRRPFYSSMPGRTLLVLTVLTALIAMLLPYSPVRGWFSFVPLSPGLMASIVVITGLYVAAAEAAKRFFYRFPAA